MTAKSPPKDVMTGRRRIFLMRHGHVNYFAPGLTDPRSVPLTDEGREQARAAGLALSHQRFDFAVSSGLPRTQETAELVLAEQDLGAHLSEKDAPPAIVAAPGLEELKSGWIQATSRMELAAKLAFSFDAAGEEGARFPPDGEFFREAETRILQEITALITQRRWRTALIVAHEGVNRILLGWACGGGLATARAFEQDLACINVLDVDVTPKAAATTGDNDDPGVQVERVVIKAQNITPYDYLKAGLSRTSLEHLFDVDFGASQPLPA